jgi:hypothetical protein
MPSYVSRETFLRALESVLPGVSKKEIVEQSSCYVFQSGKVFAYNEEVACHCPSGLEEELTGAVQAEPLLAILRKLPEDELEVSAGEGELVLTGKRRACGLRMEADVLLPIKDVEIPKRWKALPPEFADAVSVVQACAGRDESQFALTCVNLTPDWIEACDNYQLCRWNLKTPIAKPTLVRQSAVKHVAGLGMTEVAETETWLHFRSPAKLVLSCRRYFENDFPDLGEILEVGGEPAMLPKGLAEEADKAKVFTSENAEGDAVLIELKPGRLTLKGTGITGWYRSDRKVKYAGPAIKFLVAPQILMDLVKKHSDCLISAERLKVVSGSYVFVSCLTLPEGSNTEGEMPPEEDGEPAPHPKKRKKERVPVGNHEEESE